MLFLLKIIEVTCYNISVGRAGMVDMKLNERLILKNLAMVVCVSYYFDATGF